MADIVRLAPDGTIEAWGLSSDDLKTEMPTIAWPVNPTAVQLEGFPYALPEPTAPPPVGWGETLEKAPPIWDNGVLRQQWTVSTIPLAEAKAQLEEMAITLYWQKMDAVPSKAELQAESGSYAGVKTAREARFKPKLLDVNSRIQSISTPAEGHVIYLELRDLA